MKTCTGCKETKELSNFSRNKKGRDGLEPQCRTCIKARRQKFYDSNRERVLEKNREYYTNNFEKVAGQKKQYAESNREVVAARNRAYKEKNRDAVQDYQRQYREANREHRNEYFKDRRKNHPEKVRVYNQQYRSRKLNPNAPLEKFVDVDVFIRDEWVCQLCEESVDPALRHPDPLSPSLDHIVPVSHELYVHHGHSWDNVQLSHLTCNLSKRARYDGA